MKKKIETDKNKISVIVPVYNVEKYLVQCIESILSQSYEDFEVFLIDDGSTDHSPEICDYYAAQDVRISVIHKRNGGLSSARNVGIDLCEGEYICFIDSDDCIKPQMFEKMIEQIIKFDAELAICGMECFFDEDYDIEKKHCQKSIIVNEILNSEEVLEKIFYPEGWQYVVAWNKMYKKKLFEKIRYPEGLIHEDEMVIHRILAKCKKIVTLDETFYLYRQRNDSIMGKKVNVQRLDYFFALSDRIKFFYDTGRINLAKKTAHRYWGEIIWKYCNISDNYEYKNYFKINVLKDFRKVLLVLLKIIECSWKEKIAMVIFAINPDYFVKIWR